MRLASARGCTWPPKPTALSLELQGAGERAFCAGLDIKEMASGEGIAGASAGVRTV